MIILGAFLIWALGWWPNIRLANGPYASNPAVKAAIPANFGITVLIVWELLVRGFEVNPGDVISFKQAKAGLRAYLAVTGGIATPRVMGSRSTYVGAGLGGFKGRPLTYRGWNGQLRQPIAIAHPRALVAQAPLEGFLHQTNELDSLGLDRPESTCEAFE